MGRPIGKCHICGKECELTYEHIPPKKAYNHKPTKMYIGKEYFKDLEKRDIKDTSKLRYTDFQKGVGDYTLCERCNSTTGKWYAGEYIKISNAIYDYLGHHLEELKDAKSVELDFKDVYPLKFFKQIIAMFLSIIPNEYLENHKELRKYVLDRDSVEFSNKKYRISLGLLKQDFEGWSGINHLLMCNGKIKLISFLVVAPFYFVLEFNPEEIVFDNLLDITSIGHQYNYNDRIALNIKSNLFLESEVFPINLFYHK
ncbi:MAG: hypothetical protein IKI57_07215 [Clostridia bacterium]|nr:hypothetical protein [Clostridia bacterium]